VFSKWALTEDCQDVQVQDRHSSDWKTVVYNVLTVELRQSFRYRTSPDTFPALLEQGAFVLQPTLIDPHRLPGKLGITDFVKYINTKNWSRLAGT
jgi:hypothetical protein